MWRRRVVMLMLVLTMAGVLSTWQECACERPCLLSAPVPDQMLPQEPGIVLQRSRSLRGRAQPELTAAVGIIHRDCSCKPQPTGARAA